MSDDGTGPDEQSNDDESDATVEPEPHRSTDHAAEPASTGQDTLEPFDTADEEPLDDDVFDEMDTGSAFDDEDVFELIEEEDEAGTDGELLELQEVEAVGEGAIVPKSQYCERCEHFSEPPEMTCENPGTEIHELTDLDHVRVTDCPVVTERTQMASRDRD